MIVYTSPVLTFQQEGHFTNWFCHSGLKQFFTIPPDHDHIRFHRGGFIGICTRAVDSQASAPEEGQP